MYLISMYWLVEAPSFRRRQRENPALRSGKVGRADFSLPWRAPVAVVQWIATHGDYLVVR
jgi:hypothetical protein